MSSIYTSGNDKYFYSNKIKVFPCAYRGLTNPTEGDTDISINPTARLNTEYNFTHLPHTVDKASYIIEFTSKKLICVIKGYYFEIELDDSDSENKDSDKLENNYLNICVASPSSSNGDNFVEGPHLCSWESSNIEDTLDIKQGSNTFFAGLKISSGEALSKDTYQCYALKLDTSAMLPIMANKIEDSAGTGKPISQEFTTETLSATASISTPELRIASDKLIANSDNIIAKVPVIINSIINSTLEVKPGDTSVLKAESTKVTINKPTYIKGASSNLIVDGTGTFGGKLTVQNGGADITGAAILKGTVGITGKTTIGTDDTITEIENDTIKTSEITADKINIEKALGTGSLVIDKKQNNIIEIKDNSDNTVFSVNTDSGETYAKKINAQVEGTSANAVNAQNVTDTIKGTNITDIFGSTVSAIDELKLKTINPGKASDSGKPIKIVVGADSNTAVKFYNDANKSIVKADTFEGNATTASYIEVKDTDNNTIFKADSENNKVYASNLSSISADLGEVTAGAIKSRNYNGSEVIAWDKYSEGLTYTTATDDNGEYAIVAGIGTCTDTEVVIPATYNGKPVTCIGSSAFRSRESLTSVTIPDSVTSIGYEAFANCTSLTSVTIGNGVTSIGDGAFFGCSSLTSVTIPDSVTSIGNSAFKDCTSLTSVTIPDSVTSIGNLAFRYCWSLTSVTIGNGVTSIGDSAFRECTSLKSVTIGSGVTSIGDSAFEDCTSLKSITIPDGVTNIGNYAFHSCSNLKDVYYGGTESKWSAISIGLYNTFLTNATIYYYSETEPTGTGNYWHYGSDGFKISCDDELMIDSENFKVTQDGQIVATNAYIKGTINANDGAIGELILSRDDSKLNYVYKEIGPFDGYIIKNTIRRVRLAFYTGDDIVKDLEIINDSPYYIETAYLDPDDNNYIIFEPTVHASTTGSRFLFRLKYKAYGHITYLQSKDNSFSVASMNGNTQLTCNEAEISKITSDMISSQQCQLAKCNADVGSFGSVKIQNTQLKCNGGVIDLSYTKNPTEYTAKLEWDSNKITVKIYNPGGELFQLPNSKTFFIKYSTNWNQKNYQTCSITVSSGSSSGSTNVSAFSGVYTAYFASDSDNELLVSEKKFQLETNNSYISFNKTLIPDITSTDESTGYNLGAASISRIWNTIYARNPTISTSDKNVKNTIQPLTDVHTQIFDALKPVSYKFNISNNNRTHIGLIAQDVKEAVESAGITTQDFAGYCEWEKEDGTTGCGLRYSEFIAMCINEIQKLKKRVDELEAQQNDSREK